MDRRKVIYRYTYRPTQKGPHIWHGYTYHLTGTGADIDDNEIRMFIFSAIIAPLLLCVMAGLSIAAIRVYEHVTAQTPGHGTHVGKGERDKNDGGATPEQDRREDETTPPPGTADTMGQTLDEIKRLRVARSALKGEMVDLIHRLPEQEEETLRSEQPSKRNAPQAPTTEPAQPHVAT